jgi:hypothetical protein
MPDRASGAWEAFITGPFGRGRTVATHVAGVSQEMAQRLAAPFG